MPRVTVAVALSPRQVQEWTLVLPSGATVRDAVAAACGAMDLAAFAPSVWGRRAGWDQPLAEEDRVELTRGLRVDPKVARRERFRRQGARAAGLFARQRPGAKPGY